MRSVCKKIFTTSVKRNLLAAVLHKKGNLFNGFSTMTVFNISVN